MAVEPPPIQQLTPAQRRVMKIMPLLFGLFFLTFPQAFVVFVAWYVGSAAWRWWRARNL